MKPTRKITASAVAGSLTLILVYLLSQFGIVLDETTASAVTVLLTVLTGYWISDGKPVYYSEDDLRDMGVLPTSRDTILAATPLGVLPEDHSA